MGISAEVQNELARLAFEARGRAYAPYSKYQVGAAVLMESGRIYQAANVENASYGLTICAERVAIGYAVSQGERKILALTVATEEGASPCGACRQVLAEFAASSLEVYLVGHDEKPTSPLMLDDLLPHRFSIDPSN